MSARTPEEIMFGRRATDRRQRRRVWFYMAVAVLLAAHIEWRDWKTDQDIVAEAAGKAVAAREGMAPEDLTRLTHPLHSATWVEQSGFDEKGRRLAPPVRRYTPFADLTRGER